MPSVDPLSHALGGIEKQLELITKTLSEDRQAAAVYRTDIRRDLATLKDNVVDLKNRVNNTADELAEIRPDVEDYRLTKAQGVGAWNIAKTIWTIGVSLGAAGIGAIVHALWPKG